MRNHCARFSSSSTRDRQTNTRLKFPANFAHHITNSVTSASPTLKWPLRKTTRQRRTVVIPNTPRRYFYYPSNPLFNHPQVPGSKSIWGHATHPLFILISCKMHLSYLVTTALLPLGLLASPGFAEDALDTRAIKRPQTCGIVGNANTVKCREGPGTKWDVRTTLRRGTEYDFWCVYSKECITIGGSTNW